MYEKDGMEDKTREEHPVGIPEYYLFLFDNIDDESSCGNQNKEQGDFKYDKGHLLLILNIVINIINSNPPVKYS